MADRHDLTHYPRAYVHLSTTVGRVEQVETGITPNKVSVTRRGHSQAGTAELDIHGSALPFDPRLIEGVFVQVYIASPDRVDSAVNRPEHLRFVGFVDEMEGTRDEKTVVTLKARDMSAILRDFKDPVLLAGAVPRYSDTLEVAIRRILAAVPGTRAPNGTTRLALRDSEMGQRSLVSAAPPRLQDAKVQLERNMTAWSVIEHICGLLSVFVSIDLDEVVLREPTDVYGHSRPARVEYVFGGEDANLLSVATRKKFVRNRKGVKIVIHAPREPTGRIEAVYPSDAELLADRRPSTSSRSGSTTPPERDVFPGVGIHTEAAARHYAERIYRERSRQEIEGTLKTPVWDGDTLDLRNGDRITLRITADLSNELRNTRSRQAAIDLLRNRLGVSESAASALLDASDRPTDTYYVRDTTTEFEAESMCSTTIELINLIELPE